MFEGLQRISFIVYVTEAMRWEHVLSFERISLKSVRLAVDLLKKYC